MVASLDSTQPNNTDGGLFQEQQGRVVLLNKNLLQAPQAFEA
jgi:hypothetical protein